MKLLEATRVLKLKPQALLERREDSFVISRLFKLTKRRAAILGSLLLIALFIPAAFFFKTSSNKAADNAPPPSLPGESGSAVQVKRGDLRKILVLDGELRAVRSRTVFSTTQEEAKITYLPPEGSLVKAGERVVELDNTSIVSRIKDTEEKIVAAENDIVRTRAQHETALRDMEVVLSTLWLAYEQSKLDVKVPAGVVPRRKFQENQLAYEKAKTEYDNQVAKIEQKKKEQAAELQVKIIEKDKLNVQLSQIKANMASMSLTAPADGMVIYGDHWMERRKIQVGDMVWGGFPLVRLPDLKDMEVLAQVNEVDGPRLSVGQKAKIRLDSYPDTEITGSVKEIAQTAIKASWMAKAKVFRVVIALDKTPEGIMKPGMSAQITVAMGEQLNQLVVPRSAVRFENGSPQVTRIEAERNRRTVAVNVLSSDHVFYAIAENGPLKEGDWIVDRFDR